MTNLIVTNVCNQKCSYCFAESHLENNMTNHGFITTQTFERYLDYLDRSHCGQVRLLGGEPTLHPNFPLFLKMSLERGKTILVFSNGLMPELALNTILNLPPDRISVLVNVTQTNSEPGSGLKKRQFEVIEKLGKRAHLGYTIFNLDSALLSPIIKIVQDTKCSPSIRLGVAQPTPYGNVNISPKHYRRIGKIAFDFICAAHNENIETEMDCGFVRCMFSDQEITEMKQMKVNFGWHCNPIIDLVNNELAIPCFPLSDEFAIKNPIDQTRNELMNLFVNKMKHIRIIGVFPECSTCRYKISDGCTGGCLSAAIRRIHKRSFSYHFPENF